MGQLSKKVQQIVLLAGIICCVFYASEADALQVTLTDIHPEGWTWSRVFGINEKGQVVGYGQIEPTSEPHAYVWSNGIITDIHPIGRDRSFAYGITESGQIAGIVSFPNSDPNSDNVGVVMFEDYKATDLHPVGYQWSRSRGINDNGQIVGFGKSSTGAQNGLFWDGTTATEIAPSGMNNVYLYAINNSKVIAGYGYVQTTSHAFKWDNGVITDLHKSGWINSYARAINEKGQIVGEADITEKDLHRAILWNNSTAIILHRPEWKQTRARGINKSGMIVGEAELRSSPGFSHAVLWYNGNMIDINPDGWIDSRAYGINDANMIIGYGLTPQNENHAFIITVVP